MATRPSSGQATSRRAILLAVAVAAVLAGALVAAALLLRDDGDGGSAAPPAVDVSGIPQTGSILGDPDAGVTLIEFADMQCPFCAVYAEEMLPTLVDDYVRPGSVNADFQVVSILGDDSVTAARYVLAAGMQNLMWEFQQELFRNQGEEHSGWVSDDLLRETGEAVPGLDVDQLFEDAESDAVTAQANENMLRFQEAGAQGTPTVLIQIGDDEPYMIQVGLDPAALSAALDDALSG
jgi:protein-disulfide isomerase